MQNAKVKMENNTATSDDHSPPYRKGDDLAERLLSFAVRVGKLVDVLPDARLGRHIAAQLVRSGTSPAPNYAESRAAESNRDFFHKLSIALKELRESEILAPHDHSSGAASRN